MTRTNPYRAGRTAAVAILAITLAVTAHAASMRIEKHMELAPGGTFKLDTSGGSVTLAGDSADGVHVVVTSSRDDIESIYDFQWDTSADQVSVTAKRRSKISGWFKNTSMKWEISVPRDTRLEIDTSGGKIDVHGIAGEVSLDTSGGGIEVADIEGDAKLDTSGGGITVRNVTGSVDADTSGGPIKIHGAGGDIRADTSGGGIEIEDARGHVQAETSGGGITLGLAPGNAAGGSVESSGGSIHVTLDPGVAMNLDAECSGGSIASDIPVTVQGSFGKNHLQGTLNGGGQTLRIRTSGGGIKIRGL